MRRPWIETPELTSNTKFKMGPDLNNVLQISFLKFFWASH